jgi:hypothetical protein
MELPTDACTSASHLERATAAVGRQHWPLAPGPWPLTSALGERRAVRRLTNAIAEVSSTRSQFPRLPDWFFYLALTRRNAVRSGW